MTDDDITVLLVDDEPDVAATTAEFLEHEADRLAVETVGSADAGMARLGTGGVDCVVSDFEMPGQDGIEFLEAVRERYPELPFVLFTGKGSEEVAAEAISAGATDYLQKTPGNDQYTILANRIERGVDRRRADAAVEAANERLATVFERITDAVLGMDSSFRYTYANREALRLLDLERDELIGELAWDVFPELDDTAFGPALRTAMADQQPQTVEEYWPPLDTWYFVRVFPAEDGISVYFRDITERVEREAALEAERERYRRLVDSAPVGILGYDGDGEVVYANASAARLAGADDPASMEGRSVLGYLDPEDRERARARMTAVIEDETPVEPTEYRVEADDGAVRHVSVAGAPMTYDGDPGGQIVVNDVTELKDRQRLLSELHAATSDIAACTTPDGVYDRVVEAAERVFAFDLAIVDAVEGDELVPKAVSSGVDPEGYYETTMLDAGDNLAARTARTGEPSVVEDLQEAEVVPASSAYRSALTVPIGDRGVFQAVAEAPGVFDTADLEHTELLVATAREALERIDREAELEAQHDRLESFTSMVSHDLLNPLSVVAGRLELAREGNDDEDLAAASRALDRAFALIEELLAVASGVRPPMEAEAVSLADAATRCWQPVNQAEGDLEIRTEAVIEADEARLFHLLENLFANAIEHGGDEVTVTVGELERGFFVADDGVGIDPEARERVFERSYSTGDGGTGVGLGIVEQISTAHGWQLELTEGAAGGARFEFTGVTRHGG